MALELQQFNAKSLEDAADQHFRENEQLEAPPEFELMDVPFLLDLELYENLERSKEIQNQINSEKQKD